MSILVIGATSGIGLATAVLCSEKGEEVIAIGRDIAKCRSVERIAFIGGDISTEDGRQSLLEKIGTKQLTKVIHCAGIFSVGNSSCEYEKKYRDVKIGGLLMIEDIIRVQQVTHICVVSSLYTFLEGSFVPEFEKNVNAELEQLTLGLPAGIVANCIAPGLVRTPLTERTFGNEGMKKIVDLAPGAKILEPQEVAVEIYRLIDQVRINRKVVPFDGKFLENLKTQS